MRALAARARLTIAAPAWGTDLFGAYGTVVRAPRVPVDAAAAVLVKPAFRAVWEARHLPRRIGWPTDHRRVLLTDVVPPGQGHRAQRIGRLGVPLGVAVEGAPTIAVSPIAKPGVVLLPLSATGAPVEWSGYRRLADRLVKQGVSVAFAAGPGETAQLVAIAGAHRVLPELSIAALAQVVAGATAVVGNDSGLTHVAAAALRGAGRAPARVIGIVGSTDPTVTGAPGATWLCGPRVSCAPCYRKTCSRGLGCLALSVDAVMDALEPWLARAGDP